MNNIVLLYDHLYSYIIIYTNVFFIVYLCTYMYIHLYLVQYFYTSSIHYICTRETLKGGGEGILFCTPMGVPMLFCLQIRN